MSKLAVQRAGTHDRRAEIIAAAAEVWNAQGANGFTVAAVARLVGLHPVSLGHYFRTRDDLAAECMLETIARLTALAGEASRCPTARERVAAYVHGYFEIRRRIDEGVEAPLAYFGEIRRIDPSPTSRVIGAFRDYLRAMMGLFVTPSNRDDRKARVVYARLVIEYTGWAYSWIGLYSPREYAGVADRMIDILFGGIAAQGQGWPTEAPPTLGQAAQARISRERFLINATELINNHGFNGASIDSIAASLNVTKGSFYHHMADKEDLLRACFERTFALNREALAKSADAPDGWRRLHAAIAALIAYHARGDNGRLLRMQAVAALSGPERETVLQQYRDLAFRLAVVACAGVADGSVRPVDPFVASQMLLCAVNCSFDLNHWMNRAEEVDLLDDLLRPAMTGIPV